LWCPTETAWPDWALNSLKESWDSEDAVSWFTIKQKTNPMIKGSLETSSVSFMSTLAESMAAAGEPLPNLQKIKTKECTRKVRLFAPEPVANILLSWVTCSRANYNKALFHYNTTKENLSEYDLREMFVNESITVREQLPVYRVHNGYIANCPIPLCGGYTREEPRGNKKPKGKILSKTPNKNLKPWMKSVPKEIRHSGIHDYVKARETCFANLKAGNIRRFKMTYRKKGDRKYPSVNIGNKFSVEDNGKYIQMFPKKLAAAKGARNKNKKNPQGKPTGRLLVAKKDRPFIAQTAQSGFKECRLAYDCGRWYLLVPYTATVTASDVNHEDNRRGVAAGDPGARTFMTVFDGDNVVAVQQDRQRMRRLQSKLDTLRSLRAKRKITTRTFVRGRRRVKRKWSNLMSDLHWKLSSELVHSYEAFGLPSFKTGEMVQGGLAKITKRELLGLQHGKFRTRFQHKARGRTHVLPVNESFTTKTCTQCGTIRNVGGLEIYHCRNCKLVIGRDTGSSRSIFMCLMMHRWETT
jgi:transposase